MDPANHHVEAHLTMPEAHANAQGKHLGWTRFYNTDTVRGKTGVSFLSSIMKFVILL